MPSVSVPVNGRFLGRTVRHRSGTIFPMPSSAIAVPLPYRFSEVEAEIRRVLDDMPGHDLKQLAAGIGMDYKAFVRALKRSEERNAKGQMIRREFLSVEELGKIAAYVTKHYRETPPLGWPIVTFEAHRREISLIRRSIEAALNHRGGK